MRHTFRIATGLIVFGSLLIPSALAQGVIGISLQAAPNAVTATWRTPAGVPIASYKVYYSKQSILQNNGRFDGTERTIGNETSLVLLDLQNRGFSRGDTMFVTVTSINTNGEENLAFAEEKSIAVLIPDARGSASVGIENAIAEGLNLVRVQFSGPVMLPAVDVFSITDEATNTPISILSAKADGNDVLLGTASMTARSRYKLTLSETVAAADGSALDAGRKEVFFVGRGNTEIPTLQEFSPLELPQATTTTNALPAIDITPPEDVSNLTLTKSLQSDGNYIVHASWSESLNTANDLASYNLYESDDFGRNFVGPIALIATITSTTIANVPPGTLTVKLSTMDDDGNESVGIQEMIVLPETGPALLLILSAAGAGVVSMRRKRNY